MKFSTFLTLAAFTIIIGCKKEPSEAGLVDLDSTLRERIVYKTVATIASPADSARNRLKDSIIIDFTRKIYTTDYLRNYPGIHCQIYENSPGFNLAYLEQDKGTHYFSFSNYAFPTVTRDFELNKVYESTSVPGSVYQLSALIGTHTGREGMSYFINNVYPPDAGTVQNKIYTKLVFTKKEYYNTAAGGFIVADGVITGYAISYWGVPDYNKYVQRWDFSVTFEGLKINK